LDTFTELLQTLRKELGEMKETVNSERKLRMEAESKLKGMPVSTPKSRPYRRTRSPGHPRAEDEEEDILDIKTIQLAPPQYTMVRELLERYQEIKVRDCPESTAQIAEEIEGNATSDKREEKRKLRAKHRCLLTTCAAVDPNLKVLEEQEAASFSTAASRPSSSVGATADPIPPLARHFLPAYTMLDIRNTGERAFVTDKKSGSTTPIKLSSFPTDQRIFTTSFQPADDKLFPQSRLSDESTRDLAAAIGSKWTKPTSVSVKEDALQDFTARGRVAVQGTAMVEQLLRVVKVLAVQQKAECQSGSVESNRCQITCDSVDRASDILNLVNRQTMQTVHNQTLLIREAYLDGLNLHDLPVLDQQSLRSAPLFSSQVLPTQAVFTAKEEFERRTGKDVQKNLNKALHAASKPGASASNTSSSYFPGSAKRKNNKKRRNRRSQSGGRNSGRGQQPQQQYQQYQQRGRSPYRQQQQQNQQDRGSRPPSAGPRGGRGAGQNKKGGRNSGGGGGASGKSNYKKAF
jgi:hypothetical protein